MSQVSFCEHIPSRKLDVATTQYARGDLGTPLLEEDEAGCQGMIGRQATAMVPYPFTSSPVVPSLSTEQAALASRMTSQWQQRRMSRQTAATARRTDATRNRSDVGTWVYVSTRHVSLRDCISCVIREGGRCIRVSAADLHGCAAANSLLLQL